MTPEQRQAQLNSISKSDIERIGKLRAETSATIPVDEEWMAIAEMGKHFGWPAIECILPEIKSDGLSSEYMMTLLTAARKLDAIKSYDQHRAAFVGAASAQAKSPSDAFNSMTSHLIKQAKVE